MPTIIIHHRIVDALGTSPFRLSFNIRGRPKMAPPRLCIFMTQHVHVYMQKFDTCSYTSLKCWCTFSYNALFVCVAISCVTSTVYEVAKRYVDIYLLYGAGARENQNPRGVASVRVMHAPEVKF